MAGYSSQQDIVGIGRDGLMTSVEANLMSAEEHWEMFDNAARRHLDMSGSEFALRWDRGEYFDKDEPWVMYVAGLRPDGWAR